MSYQKLSKKFSPEELVDAFVFPVKLTAKQKKEAAEHLSAARQKAKTEITNETKYDLRTIAVRSRITNSLQEKAFNPEHTFGSFLKMYVELLEKKRKEFAAEISIDETLLSQLINGHRLPPDYVTIRLELHSKDIIPATLWLKLINKQKLHEFENNKELRKKEKQFVYPKTQTPKPRKQNHHTAPASIK